MADPLYLVQIKVSNSMQSICEEASKRIISLRFILSVLVVFIHNCYKLAFSSTYGALIFNQSKTGDWIQNFISFGIAYCAVPLFFLFAAYLQTRKSDSYLILLKKRIRSLFVPYCIWILFYFLFFVVTNQKFSDPSWWTFKNIAFYLIGFSEEYGGIPLAASQLWFIRDLIVLTFFSPVLLMLIKRIRFLFVLCLFVLAESVSIKFIPNFLFGLLFYTLGLYWGMYDFDLFKLVDKIKIWELIPIFVITFIFVNIKFSEVNNTAMQLSVCLIALKSSKYLISKDAVFKKLSYLSTFSFFLYVIHMPILLQYVQKIWLRFFPMKNTFFCLFEYFGVSILTIVIGTSIGILLRKICPPLFFLLSGGRK